MKFKIPNLKSNRSLFVTMVLSLGLALGAGLASTSSASAGNYYSSHSLYYGNGYHRGHQQKYRGNNRRHHVQRQNGYKRHNHHRRNRSCGPRRAVNAAWNLGLNQPQIRRVKQNRVVVSGYQRSHYGPVRTKMVFDRWSNCRLIKTVSFR